MYVIQEYVARPLLWPDGCKFHFRIYAVLSATMAVHIYRRAFAHVANKPFRTAPEGGEISPLADDLPRWPASPRAGLRRPEHNRFLTIFLAALRPHTDGAVPQGRLTRRCTSRTARRTSTTRRSFIDTRPSACRMTTHRYAAARGPTRMRRGAGAPPYPHAPQRAELGGAKPALLA